MKHLVNIELTEKQEEILNEYLYERGMRLTELCQSLINGFSDLLNKPEEVDYETESTHDNN